MAVEADPKSTGRVPRYLQLAGNLREKILSHEFDESRSFPTETQLCADFEVSRYTVREALRRLENEGLIQRKRGSGTTVQPAAARGGALHQPLSNVGELLQYARDSKIAFEPRGTCELDPAIAEQIAGPVPGRWSCYRGVRRHAGDQLPIAVTDVYFHADLAEALVDLDLARGSLFSQIERLTGVRTATITQDIQAVAADARSAGALEIEEGMPVLRIVRCYIDAARRIFEISVSYHPGDRFAYAMHIDVDE